MHLCAAAEGNGLDAAVLQQPRGSPGSKLTRKVRQPNPTSAVLLKAMA